MIKIYVQGLMQSSQDFEKHLNTEVSKYLKTHKNCMPQIANSCDQSGRMNVIVTYYNFVELIANVDVPEMVKTIKRIEAELREATEIKDEKKI